jgi:ribonuclease HII
MTPKAREAVHARMRALAREGVLAYAVAFSSAKTIDRIGIVPAVERALSSAFSRLESDPLSCEVLLDGGLKAPAPFVRQTTIIRGDDSEPIIGLASIAAKVERDARMRRLAKKYPGYGFEVHKGYGTKAHYAAIRRYGSVSEHRRSFLM